MALNPSHLEVTNGKSEPPYGGSPVSTLRHRSPVRDLDRKAPITTSDTQPYLEVPLQDSFRPSLETLSGNSNYSVEIEDEGSVRSLRPDLERTPSRSPVPPQSWSGKWGVFWKRNKGLALVLLSQLFGGLMNVAARLLEGGSGALSPFQVRRNLQKTWVCNLSR